MHQFYLSEIVASKPNYEIGSAIKLSFAKNSATKKAEAGKVWKLDADDDEEQIDEDDLLDEEDKKKPDESSLRVCGTTGKRKACKDCSCGLAEELESEKTGSGTAVDTANAKSSCGSVGLYMIYIKSASVIFVPFSVTWEMHSGALRAPILACQRLSRERKSFCRTVK